MIEELQKRIDDLRAVEHWLKFNLTMLQSTIQALEVQQTTFKAYGAWMPSGENNSGTPEGMPQPPGFDPAGWWDMLQTQFNQIASIALAGAPVASSFQAVAYPPSADTAAEPSQPVKRAESTATSQPAGRKSRAVKTPANRKAASPKKSAPAKTRKARVPK